MGSLNALCRQRCLYFGLLQLKALTLLLVIFEWVSLKDLFIMEIICVGISNAFVVLVSKEAITSSIHITCARYVNK